MSQKTIIVTGANKGIGLAIVRKLMTYPAPGFFIYLTARDISRGEAALSQLKSELADSPSSVHFHQLDITDSTSIASFAKSFEEKHGKNSLNVLINNAGIAGKGPGFDLELVKWTLACNYYGTKALTEALLPLMPRDGTSRIVNVSSTAGRLSILQSPSLRDAFSSPDLDMRGLDSLMQKFTNDVSTNTYKSEGWPTQAYGVSKVGVTALTKVFARREEGVLINACCPGWVNTDMSSGRGPKTTEEGSRTPVKLAVGDIGGVTGEFWMDERIKEW